MVGISACAARRKRLALYQLGKITVKVRLQAPNQSRCAPAEPVPDRVSHPGAVPFFIIQCALIETTSLVAGTVPGAPGTLATSTVG
jgi:hypothetical protein